MTRGGNDVPIIWERWQNSHILSIECHVYICYNQIVIKMRVLAARIEIIAAWLGKGDRACVSKNKPKGENKNEDPKET